jgi:hypothetical protein
MPNSVEITDSEFRFSFRVPEVTPKGQPVQILRDERDGVHRVHALSPDESELYLEVVSSPGLMNHEDVVGQQQRFLAEHSPDGSFTHASGTIVKSHPATEFSFQGTLGGRWKVCRFVFIDSDVRTFRIIYDPTSNLNAEVLDSLAITTP